MLCLPAPLYLLVMARRQRLRAEASAPGKAILFGEHAVVYGKTAIAAAVSDLRVHVEVAERDDGLLVVRLPHLSAAQGGQGEPETCNEECQVFSTAIASFLECGGALLSAEPPLEQEPAAVAAGTTTGGPPPCGRARRCPAALASWLSDEVLPGHYGDEGTRQAYTAILFLVLGMMTDSGPLGGLAVNVRKGSLPIGAGLGSSGALAVATAAAIYRLRELIMCSGSRGPVAAPSGAQACGSCVPEEAAAVCVNEWSFEAEVLLHGSPSGLDNTVSCFGSAVQYRKHGPGEAAAAASTRCPLRATKGGFSRVDHFPRLRVLLTNTLVPRETRALVGKVADRLRDDPQGTAALLGRIGDTSEAFLRRLREAPAQQEEEERGHEPSLLAWTSELMRRNHALLCDLGVGHPKLSQVCGASETYGLASKLTGAGGGGCALTLLGLEAEQGGPEEGASSGDGGVGLLLKQDLEKQGFVCVETVLGGPGVLWHDSRTAGEAF